ncbi:hypothetical protein HY971_04560 [Candidatus Kaiserbacteria bacterium]|nr:hypothetical protein [Candidatus Kaiserbacteria bacterium]
MRSILTLGAAALIVALIIVNGPALSHSRLVLNPAAQAGAAVFIYDEDGYPVIFDEVYPDYVVNDQPGMFYTPWDDYDYYYDYYNYGTGYGPYDYSSGDVTYYDTWDTYYYEPPPPPPPSPWYVQALPGVGSIAQPIVQGIAPQTKVSPRPTCSISSSSSTVASGGSVILRWTSQGAEWSDLTELGIVSASGSWQFDSMTRSRTFVLNLSGPGGTGSCSTVVTVLPR